MTDERELLRQQMLQPLLAKLTGTGDKSAATRSISLWVHMLKSSH